MNTTPSSLFPFLKKIPNTFNRETSLLLIGGGPRPLIALKKFVNSAGADKARIFIITWASNNPENISRDLKNEMKVAGAIDIQLSLYPQNRPDILKKLEKANGVFFSGGDQNRLMKSIKKLNLITALQAKYYGGTTFGGTSAGAAIMPEYMMTGDNSNTDKGLGLFKNAIFDQHFLIRKRENRLRDALKITNIPYAIGIDESAAILIKNNNTAEIIGPKKVIFFNCFKNYPKML